MSKMFGWIGEPGVYPASITGGRSAGPDLIPHPDDIATPVMGKWDEAIPMGPRPSRGSPGPDLRGKGLKGTSQKKKSLRFQDEGVRRSGKPSIMNVADASFSAPNLGTPRFGPDPTISPEFQARAKANSMQFRAFSDGTKTPRAPFLKSPGPMPTMMPNKNAVALSRGLKGLGTVGKMAAPLLMAGIGMYAAYSSMHGQVQAHEQVNKAFKRTRGALRNGGMTRAADFQSNPMQVFSRPRVRSGHMGASGNLTLALNNSRTA